MSKCLVAFALSLCCAHACAQHVSLKPYWTATATAAAATTADYMTTIEFMVDKAPTHYGPCNLEGGSPWLYGKTPQLHEVRTGVLMFGELGITSAASYLLRKHRSRLWIAPIGYTAIVHSQAAAKNFYFCR